MDLGLKDKTAIVTGGASNIGRAISITLAREGANVVIADLDQKLAEKVVSIIEASGDKAIAIKTDVSKYDQVDAMVQKTLGQFKSIDILVNNVGCGDVHKNFVETTPEFWDKLMSINYESVLNCCRIVLPHMIERKAGAIVSISSYVAYKALIGQAVYGGSKGAIIGLSRVIAAEVAPYGIRVNLVAPGTTPPTSLEEVTEHSLLKPFTSEHLEKSIQRYPLGRVGKAQDIANAVAFLASDVASFITGHTIHVSGGLLL